MIDKIIIYVAKLLVTEAFWWGILIGILFRNAVIAVARFILDKVIFYVKLGWFWLKSKI
ncbi:MAG: hypothetical protein QXX08_07315 [Candidatus Bathyarchaeia archaeon]